MEEKEILLNGKVDATFFETLNKVHDINAQCKAILRQQLQKARYATF